MNAIVKPFEKYMLDGLRDIENRTREAYPEFPSWAGWAYQNNPELKASNIFVVMTEQEVTGYGHLIPRPAFSSDPPELPHTFYFDFNTSPDMPEPLAAQELLFAALQARGRELLAELPPRRAEWCIQHYGSVDRQLDFVRGKGFRLGESYLLLERDLNKTLPEGTLPDGFSIFRWEIDSEEERLAFLELEKQAFPDETPTMDKLIAMKALPMWSAYAAADAAGKIAGLIMTHFDPQSGKGYIDDIFTLPSYRGRGIAWGLLASGLRHLSGNGITATQLHVADSNHPAVELYRKSGFWKVKEQLELRMPFASDGEGRDVVHGVGGKD